MRLHPVLWYVVATAAYLARPWSCGMALSLEVRPPDNPYHSVDPHGFGVMGAWFGALILAIPVLWLLLGRRPASAAIRPPLGRTAAMLLTLGTPMWLQLTYLWLPLAWSWPVVAASAAWFAIVLALCFARAPGSVSAHAVFEHRPRTAWAVLSMVAILKFGAILFALTRS